MKRIRTVAQLLRHYDQPRKRVETPELDGLDLPPCLPGDRLHHRPGGMFEIGYYAPDGSRIECADTDLAFRMMLAYKKRPESHFVARPFYRSGVRLSVSTVYLGSDHGFSWTDPPIIWETMVFEDGRGGWATRYMTPAAARAGHTAVVTAIREAQRARRESWRIRGSLTTDRGHASPTIETEAASGILLTPVAG